MIHVWLRKIGELQELACDEALVRQRYSPEDYGSCLVRVAQTAMRTDMACAVGMATRPFLQRRLAMLFNYQAAVRCKLAWSFVALVVSTVPAICLAYAVSDPQALPLDRSHVDARIQRIADEEVRSALAKNEATSAAVVVVEPRSGNIIAFAEAGTAGWEARKISPGSVIKPLLFEAAITAGLVRPDTLLDCRGPLSVEGFSIEDHEAAGKLSVTEALARSSNVGAVRVSEKLGLSMARSALAAYGLRDEDRKPGDSDAVRLAKLTVGQSVGATLSTVARAYGKLATQGSDAIRSMLTEAVLRGTGSRATVPGFPVAGKTGTVRVDGAGGRDTVLASFAGFVPSSDPRFVIYAIVENPKTASASGGSVAAPLFQRVAARGLLASSR
jgi:cell division protein FtsI/penicillin-binding protein 2